MQKILCFHRKLATLNLLIVISSSVLVLVAYQFDEIRWQNLLLGNQLSNPVTALCFVVSAVSLFFLTRPTERLRRWGQALGVLIIVVGIVRFFECSFNYSTGIDRWLFPSKLHSFGIMGHPNYMAPNTALLFAVLGSALFFYPFRIKNKNLLCDHLAFGLTILSFFCIIGYFYHSTELYHVTSSIPMAFPTAVSFFLIATAILLKRSAFGFFSLFARKYIGSRIARFLMPFAIMVPLGVGMFRLYGERHGWFSEGFGEAFLDTLNVLVFILLIWRCCIFLNKENKALLEEMKKRKVAEELALINESFLDTLIENLPEMVFLKDENLCFVRVNKAAEQTLGLSRTTLLGKSDFDFLFRQEAEHLAKKDREALELNDKIEIPEEKISRGNEIRWLHTKKIVVHGVDGKRYLLGISQDITERKVLEEHLRQFNRELERKVVQRTSQLEQKEKEKRMLEKTLLEEKINLQKNLMQATIEGQEKEKKLIGMELHDNINQVLTSTKLYIEMARTEDNARPALLDKSLSQIEYSIREIRNLSKSLVPHGFESGGWKEGVFDLISAIKETRDIDFITSISDRAISGLNFKDQISLYRIIQEQLNNILKHADAKVVRIQLLDTEGLINLTITDDGKGFEVLGKRAGIGLSNIKSRVELLNGKMKIESSPGKGCSLEIIFFVPVSNCGKAFNEASLF